MSPHFWYLRGKLSWKQFETLPDLNMQLHFTFICNCYCIIAPTYLQEINSPQTSTHSRAIKSRRLNSPPWRTEPLAPRLPNSLSTKLRAQQKLDFLKHAWKHFLFRTAFYRGTRVHWFVCLLVLSLRFWLHFKLCWFILFYFVLSVALWDYKMKSPL